MLILEPDGSIAEEQPRLQPAASLETLGATITDAMLQGVASRLIDIESTLDARINAAFAAMNTSAAAPGSAI